MLFELRIRHILKKSLKDIPKVERPIKMKMVKPFYKRQTSLKMMWFGYKGIQIGMLFL